MGKHERDWAEVVEQEVASALQGKSVSKYNENIARAVEKEIYETFHCSIKGAVWVGSESYDDAGDVHVYTDNSRKIPVEIKCSKQSGSGTKANPSTNILKKYLRDIMNYPDFDEELGLRSKRFELIEQHSGSYPQNNSAYQKILRELKKQNNGITDQIAEITLPGKVKYASYAADKMNADLKGTQALVDAILEGNNTTQDSYTPDLVYCVIKMYGSSKQTVEFYDFDQMDSTVTKVTSEGSSIKIQNASGKSILTMSVHWKNICQGGATPCFNIFVGNAFH